MVPLNISIMPFFFTSDAGDIFVGLSCSAMFSVQNGINQKNSNTQTRCLRTKAQPTGPKRICWEHLENTVYKSNGICRNLQRSRGRHTPTDSVMVYHWYKWLNVSHICLIKFKGQKRKMIDVLFCHVSKVTYSKVFVYDNKWTAAFLCHGYNMCFRLWYSYG